MHSQPVPASRGYKSHVSASDFQRYTLTAVARSRITWPEQILWIATLSMGLMEGAGMSLGRSPRVLLISSSRLHVCIYVYLRFQVDALPFSKISNAKLGTLLRRDFCFNSFRQHTL